MLKFVAAIDQGTTSTRCILFDHDGNIAGVAQKEHQQIYPRPGWVEHDPVEIWQAAQEVIRGALNKAGARAGDIAAIGVTNQRETTIVWDRHSGKPYYNAIVWQDTRTKEVCDALAMDGGMDRFRLKTGLPLATYFSGPKIKWILDKLPGVRQAAEQGDAIFGNIDTWLIWWLTGGPQGGSHVTDVTNASRTLLMDLKTLDWDADILKVLDIPRQMLPRIVPSADPKTWGATKVSGPFKDIIPVSGDLGDQQAALVGQACFKPGEAKNTYGTGCFMLLNTGNDIVASKSGLLTTVGYRFGATPAVYALEGSIAIAGALVQWLRDNLGLISKSSDIEELARQRVGQRRYLLRTGILGSLCSVLALGRPRCDRWHDALHQQGAHRPRRAGIHGLPDARGPGGNEERCWRCLALLKSGRGHGATTTCSCSSNRTS